MSTRHDGVVRRSLGPALLRPALLTLTATLALAGCSGTEDEADGKPMRGEIRQERKHGLRRASVRDFHSFRVSWVKLALNAGVPMEHVQKVTGHRTAQIVQKHYFQPGKEVFRAALAEKLPALMGGKVRSELTREKICARLETMNAGNWGTVRQELLAGLRALEEKHALIGDARGKGLMCALELVSDREKKTPPAKDVVQKVQDIAYQAGVLMRTSGPNVIISPPLIITAKDVERILSALDEGLTGASK